MPKMISPNDDFSITTILLYRLDDVELDVGPVKRVVHGVIEGECRGLAELAQYQCLASAAIHPGQLDFGLTAAVGPVNAAKLWVHRHRGRLLEVLRHQAALVTTVGLRDQQTTATRGRTLVHLRPVEIARDPVH